MKTLARSHFCSLTGFAASTQVLSSTRSQLLPPPDCNFCWREVQVYLSSCRFRFLQCHPTWHPSWAVLVEYWSNCGEKPASVTMSDSFSMRWSGDRLQQLLFYPFLWRELALQRGFDWAFGLGESLQPPPGHRPDHLYLSGVFWSEPLCYTTIVLHLQYILLSLFFLKGWTSKGRRWEQHIWDSVNATLPSQSSCVIFRFRLWKRGFYNQNFFRQTLLLAPLMAARTVTSWEPCLRAMGSRCPCLLLDSSCHLVKVLIEAQLSAQILAIQYLTILTSKS